MKAQSLLPNCYTPLQIVLVQRKTTAAQFASKSVRHRIATVRLAARDAPSVEVPKAASVTHAVPAPRLGANPHPRRSLERENRVSPCWWDRRRESRPMIA
jgi:hypothetical protein